MEALVLDVQRELARHCQQTIVSAKCRKELPSVAVERNLTTFS